MARKDISSPPLEAKRSVEETITFMLADTPAAIFLKDTQICRSHLGDLHIVWDLMYNRALEPLHILDLPDVVKGVGPMKDLDLACTVIAQFKPISRDKGMVSFFDLIEAYLWYEPRKEIVTSLPFPLIYWKSTYSITYRTGASIQSPWRKFGLRIVTNFWSNHGMVLIKIRYSAMFLFINYSLRAISLSPAAYRSGFCLMSSSRT